MSSHPQPDARSAAHAPPIETHETRQACGDGAGFHSQGCLEGGTDEAASKAGNSDDWCTQCQASRCLALLRADEPPKDWKDLILRLAILFSSGHWSWRKTANLAAMACCLALLLYVLYASLWGNSRSRPPTLSSRLGG